MRSRSSPPMVTGETLRRALTRETPRPPAADNGPRNSDVRFALVVGLFLGGVIWECVRVIGGGL